jgi:hypothetical protein
LTSRGSQFRQEPSGDYPTLSTLKTHNALNPLYRVSGIGDWRPMSDYGQSARKNFWGNVRSPAGAGEYRPSEPRLRTCFGILHRLWRHSLRLLCPECGEMSFVQDVVGCADATNSMTVDCVLTCSHPRNLTIAVRSPMCDRCEARWIKDQWAHSVDCPAKKREQVSERRAV